MNKPTYKIHGIKRRELKKRLSKLKVFVRNYMNYYNLDNDMYCFYGCENPNLPTKEQAHGRLNLAKLEIAAIESRLAVLYQD